MGALGRIGAFWGSSGGPWLAQGPADVVFAMPRGAFWRTLGVLGAVRVAISDVNPCMKMKGPFLSFFSICVFYIFRVFSGRLGPGLFSQFVCVFCVFRPVDFYREALGETANSSFSRDSREGA